MPDEPRSLVILGSTGSIGRQALDIARAQPGRFRVVGLAAGGSRLPELAAQAREFEVGFVAVPEVPAAALEAFGAPGARPEILAGADALTEAAARPADLVLNAVTGAVGLAPTLAALDAGRVVALANKESLVVGGDLVLSRAEVGRTLIPVDSEHSALAQCLRAGRSTEVRRLVLTASGGPFRDWPRDRLATATVEAALTHPTWSMGPVITVNSATLVNKGLELIEAHLLFGIPYDSIDVMLHPQSVIHSMVEFVDGSTLAQLGPPDMRVPISVALGWPDRLPEPAAGLDWTARHDLAFEPLPEDRFPAVAAARRAGAAGGTAPAVFNAANEEGVAAFLAGRIPFPAIVETVVAVLEEHLAGTRSPRPTLAEIHEAQGWARERAGELLDPRPRPAVGPGRRPGRVLLASPRGYCAGVDRAVRTVEVALEHHGSPVYVRKEIVHNSHVVARLRDRGAVFVDELDEVPDGALVVYSAHGVAPVVHEQARARNLRAIDATCPLVTKVHKEARRLAAEDYDILLIGHEGHEEVVGTFGEAPERMHVVDGPEGAATAELRTSRSPDGADGGGRSKVAWLSQTTLSVDETMATVEALRKRFPDLVDPPSDDICYATQNRQAAAKRIAAESDVVIVVGSGNSSNSVRLVEVALSAGAGSAHLIDDAEGVDPRWLRGAGTVGVTSGASVPADLVTGVLERLAALGFAEVEEIEEVRESLAFALPRGLAEHAP